MSVQIILEEIKHGLYRANLDETGRIPLTKIQEFIKLHELLINQLNYRRSFYLGRNPSILADVAPSGNVGPWNQIPVATAKPLIDIAVGFMYKPGLIRYETSDAADDAEKVARQEYYDKIKEVFEANDEASLNAELGHDQAVYGRAYELHFVGDNPDIPQFAKVDPRECFPIYSFDIKKKMIAAVRFVTEGENSRRIYVYYADTVIDYSGDTLGTAEEIPHPYGMVPLVEILNNEYGQGDIDPVARLIDAYDQLLSSGMDEEEKFADAILLLYGKKLDPDTQLNLKKYRVIDDLRKDEDLKYLTKDGTGVSRMAMMDVLKKQIHKISMIPDMTDEGAIGNKSGEAMIYLFALFELLAGVKQSYFDRAISKRIQLVTNALSFPKSSSIGDADWLSPVWTRNLPKNVLAISQIVQALNGVVSKETLYGQLPFVDDPVKELERFNKEQGANPDPLAPTPKGL